MTFIEWLEFGKQQGWISDPICSTHDGVPDTEQETVEWEKGYDPCQHVLRLWPQGSK